MLKEKFMGQYDPEIKMTGVILTPDSSIEEVLESKEYFLDPLKKWDEYDHFVLKGSGEDYPLAHKDRVEKVIAKAMIKKFGWADWPDPEVTNAYKEALEDSYKDWWE